MAYASTIRRAWLRTVSWRGTCYYVAVLLGLREFSTPLRGPIPPTFAQRGHVTVCIPQTVENISDGVNCKCTQQSIAYGVSVVYIRIHAYKLHYYY